MKRKQVMLLALLSFCANIAWSQDYIVTDVKELPQDLSARTTPRKDSNGELCALLKINSPNIVKSIKGNVVGKIESDTTQTLTYITKGTKTITINLKDATSHQIIFKDWGISTIPSGGCVEINIMDLVNMDEYVLMAKGKSYYERGLYKYALSTFKRLAQVGKNEELRTCGLILMGNYYTEKEKDYSKAIDIYSKMPEGDKKYLCLGATYSYMKNFKVAIENFVKAEQYGSKQAIGLLLKIYKGEIPSNFTDKKKAVDYGIKLAALGNVDAQHFVACCYLGGLGVTPSLDDAIEYMTMAATQGKVESQRMLGAIYVQKNNLTKARIWLKMAVAQKDKDAISLLNEIGWE